MEDTCFVGLNVNSRPPHFTVVGLDAKLNTLFDFTGNWEDISSRLDEYQQIILALNSPVSPNTDFLRHSQKKKHKPGKWPDVRCIEYELAEYGAPIYHTPKKKSNLLASQQYGSKLVENLKSVGFIDLESDGEKRLIEVPAETAFWSIDRKPLFEEFSFIGRIQRQLLLLELGFKLPDPMDFFEELTRFKLLTGKAPLDMVFDVSRLNACINAFTALKIKKDPSRVAKLGYPQEGYLYLPFILPDWEEPESSIQESLF